MTINSSFSWKNQASDQGRGKDKVKRHRTELNKPEEDQNSKFSTNMDG